MNRKQPYEQALSEKAQEFPLPDEDRAWQQMEALLDRKKRRRPGFFLTWGVLLSTGLLVVTALWFTRQHSGKQSLKGREIISQRSAASTVFSEKGISKNQNLIDVRSIDDSETQIKRDVSTNFRQVTPETIRLADNKTNHKARGKTGRLKTSSAEFTKSQSTDLTGHLSTTNRHKIPSSEKQQDFLSNLLKDSSQPVNRSVPTPDFTEISSDTSLITSTDANESTNKQNISVQNIKPGNSADQKTAATTDFFRPPVALKPKFRQLSAGLAIQHPLQFSGQKAVAYGYNAGSRVSDYIPSVWLRYERPRRWFFQGEFIYSAPQLVKAFAFSQQTKADTGFTSVTTVLRMKKTYFNQIPLSFNVYLRRNWSLGAGLGYAWLQGAITQRDITRNTSQGPVVDKREIVPVNGFTDSFLYRSHSLFLVQTEYRWKRLSAGVKFTRDFQSFITYTTPDGRMIDKKNSALSVVLRFKLWER